MLRIRREACRKEVGEVMFKWEKQRLTPIEMKAIYHLSIEEVS
jgi:hypothetical protein